MPPPSFEEQISFLGGGYLAPEQEGEQQTFFSQPQLPQQVIDEALCIGFNDRNSRLIICAHYMKDKPLEENAAFLQKSYGTNGAGLFVQDREYAIWYDPEGIRIATGRTVQKRYTTLVTWEQAAKRIRELLDLGRYMPQSELDRVQDFERMELAKSLIYARREFSDEARDAGYLPLTTLTYSGKGGFPEIEAQMQRLLEDRDALSQLVDEWTLFAAVYEKDRSLLRSRWYDPIALLRRLEDLQREPHIFTAAAGYAPQRRFFISDDEIDRILRGSERSYESRLDTFSFFSRNTDTKERERFLKQQHGEYSGYHGGNDSQTYTSAGLSFSHGSLTEPYAHVELKWPAITKRISDMISLGRFLYPSDAEKMADYEVKQLAKLVINFFRDAPDEYARPTEKSIFDYWDGVADIQRQLSEPERVKTLDKVRPGGIVAFITSKGTMDKENSAVRKYIAQRADLIGAIRLPNTAFKRNAGTEVTSDILFLQKRDRMTDIEPDWVHLDTDANGIRMNSYFVQHPDMILGEMVMESTRFGMDSVCRGDDNADLSELLQGAIQNLHAEITEYQHEELEEEDNSIPADPNVRNFSYTIVDGKVYFRENSRMNPVEFSVTAENRIRGMIALRDCVRRLIDYQTEGYPDEDIQKEQTRLNTLYDDYTKKYGLLSSRGNSLAFGEDSSYFLLCSLEVLDEEGNFKRKADMFTKRTILPHVAVTSVDTASEALAVSIAEKARVDMPFMAELSGKTEAELEAELAGVIFRDVNCAERKEEIPVAFVDLDRYAFVTADEYLSGNVRRKLRMVKALCEVLPEEKASLLQQNVTALEAVQPVDLSAGEIGVRIGVNWVPREIYEQFLYEVIGTSAYARDKIHVLYSPHSGEWNVLIFFVTTAIMRYAASHVPIILSIHIYLGACSEPASPTVPVTL